MERGLEMYWSEHFNRWQHRHYEVHAELEHDFLNVQGLDALHMVKVQDF